MARFTKALRQEIVREFAARHDGRYDPALFVQEVRATGPDHPAYEWFEWRDDKAATDYRLWQAREFVQGLKVSFEIEEIGRKPIKVRAVEAPLMVSPEGSRKTGGGYFLLDPTDPDHMAELCRQGAADLRRWLRRYGAALAHAGGFVTVIEKQAKALEAASEKEVDKAA